MKRYSLLAVALAVAATAALSAQGGAVPGHDQRRPRAVDAAWDETADYVLDNIRKAGFNPRDIKYLIITHAHIDHFAGTERIRKATAARVAAG